MAVEGFEGVADAERRRKSLDEYKILNRLGLCVVYYFVLDIRRGLFWTMCRLFIK